MMDVDVHSVENCVELYLQRELRHDYIYTRQHYERITLVEGDKVGHKG